MVKAELWRRWRWAHAKETVDERLYVKFPDGKIWRSEWRRVGLMPFYVLWRSGTWQGVAEIEPDARKVGNYKLQERRA